MNPMGDRNECLPFSQHYRLLENINHEIDTIFCACNVRDIVEAKALMERRCCTPYSKRWLVVVKWQAIPYNHLQVMGLPFFLSFYDKFSMSDVFLPRAKLLISRYKLKKSSNSNGKSTTFT